MAESQSTKTIRDCTCLGTCKGKEGLAPGWQCALDADVEKHFGPPRIRDLARRAGILADVVANRRTVPLALKDEIVVILRECERVLLEGR